MLEWRLNEWMGLKQSEVELIAFRNKLKKRFVKLKFSEIKLKINLCQNKNNKSGTINLL